MKEKWQDIEGYEGLYQISNTGKVKGIHGEHIKGWAVNGQYRKVRLYKDKEYKDYYVHRLVAIAFIPIVHGKNHVNHIDNNPSNNDATNLEWCTHQENMQHAKNQNRMSRSGVAVYRIKDMKKYDSIKDAAEDNGILMNTLVYQLKRNSKVCKFKKC